MEHTGSCTCKCQHQAWLDQGVQTMRTRQPRPALLSSVLASFSEGLPHTGQDGPQSTSEAVPTHSQMVQEQGMCVCVHSITYTSTKRERAGEGPSKCGRMPFGEVRGLGARLQALLVLVLQVFSEAKVLSFKATHPDGSHSNPARWPRVLSLPWVH